MKSVLIRWHQIFLPSICMKNFGLSIGESRTFMQRIPDGRIFYITNYHYRPNEGEIKVKLEDCFNMNEKIARAGSIIVSITVAIFAVCMLIDFSFGSFFICMILPIGFIMMTSGFYNESASSKKVAAMNGVIFATIYVQMDKGCGRGLSERFFRE